MAWHQRGAAKCKRTSTGPLLVKYSPVMVFVSPYIFSIIIYSQYCHHCIHAYMCVCLCVLVLSVFIVSFSEDEFDKY